MKKIITSILLSVSLLFIVGCGSSENQAEKDLKEKIKGSIDYFDKQVLQELPRIVESKEHDIMVSTLKEIIAKLEKEAEYYKEQQLNGEISEELKEASKNVEYCFNDVTKNALTPMVSVYDGSGGTPPSSYKQTLQSGVDKLMVAKDLVK